MKSAVFFGSSSTRTLHRLTSTLFLTLGLAVAARADFSTGFETTSGSYTAGSTIANVHDTGLAGAASWSPLFGTSTNTGAFTITNTAANVQSGTQALHIYDNDTGVAYGASYNLAGAVNYSTPFTLHFGLNVSSLGGSGNPVQFYLGDNSTAGGTKPYWTFGYVSTGGIIYLNEASSVGGSAAQAINLGNYTDYSAYGSYITFDITIDPTTHLYTNVTIGGTLKTLNKTSAMTSASAGGEIPWLNGAQGTPLSNFVLAAGTGTTSTFDIDNLSISNVPEPTTVALAAFGTMILLGRRRSRLRHGI